MSTLETAYVVDLDGTLIRTDMLFEQVLRLAKTRPLRLLQLPVWLLSGIAHLKARLSEVVAIDAASLPYRDSVLTRLRDERTAGRRTVLASASHERIVKQVSDHLHLFDSVIATGAQNNLKGRAKLAAIIEHLKGQPFVYVGDARADLAIWAQSAKAIAINPTPGVTRSLNKLSVPHEILRDDASFYPTLVAQLRVHQWVKNLLVFVPMLAGHHYNDPISWLTSLLAFGAFSAVASSVYVLNDMFDAEADRAHPTKCNRPFAAGKLPLKAGFILCPILLLIGAVLTAPLSGLTAVFLLIYFTMNVAYSLKLKRVIILDVMMLATFYALRILVGGAASQIPVSTWLLSFSIFFFFGLAMEKRFTELLRTKDSEMALARGRSYRPDDLVAVLAMGVASSFLAVVIFVLYLDSRDVKLLYSQPWYLWLVTPIILYWTSRNWLLTYRGEINDDPVLFSIKDWVSWLVALLVGLILYASI